MSTGAAFIEVSRRTEAGQYLAGRVVDHQQRQRNIRPQRLRQRLRALARQLFQILL
jgi:hypothetical protein